jgi:hypothetical protein
MNFFESAFHQINDLKEIIKLDNIVNRRLKYIRNLAANKKVDKSLDETKEVEVGVESTQATALPVYTPPQEPLFWFDKYDVKDIVAIDVEYVQPIPNLPENADPSGYIDFYAHKAATVSIVDFYGNEIYSDRVKYGINTFEVNYALTKINGFKADSFVNGTDFNIVKENVKKHLVGKLIIMWGFYEDLCSLRIDKEMKPLKLDIFDLQGIYRWRVYNDYGEFVATQPLGLARVYSGYYGQNPHLGVHSALEDAINTMRIFREKYMTGDRCENQRREVNYEGYEPEEFPQIQKTLQRRKKYYD